MQASNKNRVLRKLDSYINEIPKLDDGTNTNTVLSLIQEIMKIQTEIEKMSSLEAESYCSIQLAKLEESQIYYKLMRKVGI